MEVHVSRASAFVGRHVPVARADWFMEWQHGVSEAAEGFAGYRSIEVYPPVESGRDERVVLSRVAREFFMKNAVNWKALIPKRYSKPKNAGIDSMPGKCTIPDSKIATQSKIRGLLRIIQND